MNAVVSLACKRAAEVYRPGYRAPEGGQHAKAAAVADMDKLAAWLESDDDLDGMTVAEARNKAAKDLELEWSDLTPTRFGTKVAESTKWTKVHKKTGNYVHRRQSLLTGIG